MKSWQKYAAEFFGTFVLVGIGTGAIIGVGGDSAFVVTVSLAFGLALITALYTVGRISGGHFNPAVSLAAFVGRRIGLTDLVAYWVAQVAGALTAAALLAAVLDRTFVARSYTQLSRPVVNEFAGFVAEAVFTMVFVFAVLVLAKSESQVKYLGMGLALAAVHFVGIAFTGASVNPARTLAPALVGGTWDGFWVFIAGPALGALFAWALHKIIIEGDIKLDKPVSG